MADVTGGTAPTNASTFGVPADIQEVYDHFGGQTKYSVATSASLPGSGNWLGRRLMAENTGILYVCTALPATWKKVTAVEDTLDFQAVAPTDLTFGSGWSHHLLSGWAGVQLRVKNGRVIVNGAAAKSSFPTDDLVATLVAAYRPAKLVQGINVLVNTSGQIRTGIASTIAMSFRAEWDLG